MTIQNLFFVPVPIFSLDIKKVLEAFRVHWIFGIIALAAFTK
jgi:hypothetical protein